MYLNDLQLLLGGGAFLLAFTGVASYTYLATARMKVTLHIISSITTVILVAHGVDGSERHMVKEKEDDPGFWV